MTHNTFSGSCTSDTAGN